MVVKLQDRAKDGSEEESWAAGGGDRLKQVVATEHTPTPTLPPSSCSSPFGVCVLRCVTKRGPERVDNEETLSLSAWICTDSLVLLVLCDWPLAWGKLVSEVF